MSEVIFNISDIALKVKYKNKPPFCRTFRKFTAQNVPAKDPWSLDSIDINKKGSKKKLSCGMRSFFFDDPVRINLDDRKITHFYSNDTPHPVFNDRLITYAYSQALAASGGMLLHAAAVAKDGAAFLFFGRSGGGKTTVAELSKWYDVIGDDVVAVRKAGTDFFVFPTPWRQRNFIKAAPSHGTKIAGIFFLKKSRHIRFERLAPEESLSRMLSSHIHFLTYTERPFLDDIFLTAHRLAGGIPAYSMEFSKDRDFWPRLEEAVYAG